MGALYSSAYHRMAFVAAGYNYIYGKSALYKTRFLVYINHIEPPLDVNNEEAVRKFLEKVEAWYAGGQEFGLR